MPVFNRVVRKVCYLPYKILNRWKILATILPVTQQVITVSIQGFQANFQAESILLIVAFICLISSPHVAIVCDHLPDPVNGDISFYSDTTAPFDFGTNATYSCDSGFGLSGEDTVRTCDGEGSSPNGDWDGTAPTCERNSKIN